MTRLVWDQAGQRIYENGVSQGVFYGSDSKGIPWNGLVSVEENTTDDVEALYYDGLRYADLVTLGDFEGKITAITYPDEFLPYEGVDTRISGFALGNQPKRRFGLSYKTEINNDQGSQIAYKIHLLYNVLAIPSTKTYQTLSLSSEPAEFEWDISTIPEEVDRYRPTAHVIIDSRDLDPILLDDIENLLYGTEEADALLPDLNGFVSFVQKWGRFIVTDNGDGTWTATTPLDGIIEFVDEDNFTITADEAVVVDADTYTLTSSVVDDDDIHP